MHTIPATGSHRRDLLAVRQSVPQTPGGVAQLLVEALSQDGRPREAARLLIQAALRIATDLQHEADDRIERDGTACCIEAGCDCEPDIGEKLCRGHILEAYEREAERTRRWVAETRRIDAIRAVVAAVDARAPLALPAPAVAESARPAVFWKRSSVLWHAVPMYAHGGVAICGAEVNVGAERNIPGLPPCEHCVALLHHDLPAVARMLRSHERIEAERAA